MMRNIKHLLVNPIVYLTLACYVGEASFAVVGIPLDINSSVMYFLFFISILLILYKKKIRLIRRFDIVIVFYVYIILRNIPLKHDDFFEYWLPNVITFFIILLLCKTVICFEQYELFIMVTYAFVLSLMILGIIKAGLTGGRLAVFGGPNGFYKFAMLFQTCSFAKFLFSKKKIYIAGLVLGALLAVLTGSKGAIISLLVILPLEYFIFLFQTKGKKEVLNRFFKLLLIFLLLGLLFFTLIQVIPSLNAAFARGIGIFSSDRNKLTSVSARVRLWSLSIGYFKEKPIFGAGARHLYYDTMFTDDPQPYAHNVFFEILGEQGIVGFTLLCLIIFQMYKSIRKMGMRNYYAIVLLLFFVVYLIGAQFSGNILDTKMMMVYSEMIIVLGGKRNLYEKSELIDIMKV